MEAAGETKLKDAFVTLGSSNRRRIDVVDETAVATGYKRVTLRMPPSPVLHELWGHIRTSDVDRAAILELIRTFR